MKSGRITPRAEKYLRIFLVESPNPLDVLENRSESAAVAEIARLIGHTAMAQTVRSLHGLTEACAYIASICCIKDYRPDTTLCLHISAHGADDGLQIGRDEVDWEDLLTAVKPVFTSKYKGPRVLILSACEADQQKLTLGLNKAAVTFKRSMVPPKYVFCTTGEVYWPDAAVGWTLLYHFIPTVDLDDKGEVQEMLAKITSVTGVTFPYFRWDEEKRKYLRWPPASNSPPSPPPA
jgi:hypothetical protein